ncbi:hypothetical protein Btru_029013 [Bulinus truncatus]|nr:hypothetical protein Btru_029013 [Bulinus truncatus]
MYRNNLRTSFSYMDPIDSVCISTASNENRDISNGSSTGAASLSDHILESSVGTSNKESFVVDLNKTKVAGILDPGAVRLSACPAEGALGATSTRGSSVNSIVIHLDRMSETNSNGYDDRLYDNDEMHDENRRMEINSLFQSKGSSESGTMPHKVTHRKTDEPEASTLLFDETRVTPLRSSSSSISLNSSSVESVSSIDMEHIVGSASSEKDAFSFQPIILDVRGSCVDSNFEAAVDLGGPFPVQDNISLTKSLACPTDRVDKSPEAIPENAKQTLKGTIDAAGPGKSQLTDPDHSSLKSLLNLAKNTAFSSTRSNSPRNILKNGRQRKLVRKVKKTASQSSISQMQTVQKTLPNNKNLSNFCVMVQDEVSTCKVAAIMVPKEDGQKIFASTNNTPTTCSDRSLPGELVSGQGRQLVSQSNSCLVTPVMTLEERIKNLIDRTLANANITGKDLKGFGVDLLKLPSVNEMNKLKESATEFMCEICMENFEQQSGLDGHYARTVFNLIYDCPMCLQAFSFTNKCQLYLHCRSHLLRTFQYNNILSFMPYDCNKINPPLLLDHDQNSASKDQMGSYTLPVGRMICGAVDVNKFDSAVLKCSECQACLQQQSRAIYSVTSCPHCSMCLPSLCAFKAHRRLHSLLTSKITCPECGEVDFTKDNAVENKKKALFDHFDQCKHFNRVAEMKCICGETYIHERQLKQHFVNNHIRFLYKCQLCALAFTQREQLISHLSSIHRALKASLISSLLCTYCHVILKKVPELKKHLDEHHHAMKMSAVFRWKCFLCSKICSGKEELQLHSDDAHPHKPKRCTICYALFSSRKNLVEHIMQKKCFSAPYFFHKCADLEPDSCNFDISYNQYFKSEFIIVPKIISPVLNADTGKPKYIRIAPKAAQNSLLTVNNLSTEENKQANSVICDQQNAVKKIQNDTKNDQGNAQNGKILTLNKQGSVSNTSVSSNGAKSSSKNAKSPYHPVIVNKQLTFPNYSEDTSHKSVELADQSAHEISGLNFKVPCPQSFTISMDSIFLCHHCKVVLVGRNRYEHHMEKHTENGDHSGPIDISQCVVCEKTVKNSELFSHLQNHQAEGVIICCRCQSRNFKSMELAIQHGNRLCGYPVVTDMEVSEKKSAVKRGAKTDDGEKSSVGAIKADQASVFPCLLCGLAFLSLEKRDEHVSRLHDGTRVIYHCLKCQKKDIIKTFSKKDSVVKHIVKKHRVVKKTSVEKFIRAEETNASNGQKLPEACSSDSDFTSCLPPKRLRMACEGDYMCGRCGFSCSSSTEFSEHILSHNVRKEPQCPECGLCFIVLSALKKHLFAVHKIKQVEEFLKNKDIHIPELEEGDVMEDEIFPLPSPLKMECSPPAAERKSLNPLECKVCYRVFDTETNLKTHMRNHGMAFIRSKRHKTSLDSS